MRVKREVYFMYILVFESCFFFIFCSNHTLISYYFIIFAAKIVFFGYELSDL